MVEKEKPVDRLKEDLKEMVRGNARLEEFADGNLNYLKPRVRDWLKVGLEFPLEEVLTEGEEEIVKFYLGLDGDKRIHSLADTAAYLGWSPKSKELIGRIVRYCWIKLKRRETVGPDAIETLKLLGPIYLSLRRKGVKRIDEIFSLSDEEIRGICGTEWGLTQLKEAIQSKEIDWHPKVEFPLLATRRKGY